MVKHPSRTAASAAARASFAMVAVLVAVAGLWWVTAGSWDLGEDMGFSSVFDGQARAFRHGRVDLDCSAASGEAFVVAGKCYVYFGPVPALLRLPLTIALPAWSGQTSRAMVWLANLLLAAVLLLIFEVGSGYRVGSWPSVAFLLLAVFGTTIPYMWGWPTAYVEALSWAVAFSAAAIYCLLRWARGDAGRWLELACAFGLLSFFSRTNTGAGPLTAVGLAALWGWHRDRRRSVALLASLAAFAVVFFGYNYARFGGLDPLPMRYHVQYDQARLSAIGGTLFHPSQAAGILVDYLTHLPRFRSSYPYLEFRSGAFFDLGPMDMPHHHVHTGALPAMPVFAWLAWAGWRGLARGSRTRRVLLAAVPSVALLSAVVAMTHRYQHEFVVLLAPAAAFGVKWAWSTPARRMITVALAVWGIYANWALALVGQREVQPWTAQKAVDQHAVTRFVVDRQLGLASLPLSYNYLGGDAMPPRVEGVTVRMARTGSIYRFSGGQWRLESGAPQHRYTLRIVPEGLADGSKTDLLFAGEATAADIVTLEKVRASRYRVCLNHWGSAGLPCGPEFDMVEGREYRFVCDLERLNRRMRVTLNGEVVAERDAELYFWREQDVSVRAPAIPVQ